MPVKRMDATVPIKAGKRGPGRPPYDSAETRDMLMNTAEEFFADLGVEGVSIRSINAAAGLAPAAVHYHFYSKDRLLDAVLHRRGDALWRRMGELLDKLEASGKSPTARDLVETMAVPFREMLQRDPIGGMRWQRLVARLVLSQDARLSRLTSGSGGLDERFISTLHRAFPDVPEQPLEAGWSIAISTLIQMLGNSDNRLFQRVGKDGTPDPRAYGDLLVEFVASGLASLVAVRRRAQRGNHRGAAAKPAGARRRPVGRGAKPSPRPPRVPASRPPA